MDIRTIVLTELDSAVAESGGKPVLLLDPEGNSEMFYKYKGSLIMTYVPNEANDGTLRAKFKWSVDKGDTLVLSMLDSDEPSKYFKPDIFPQEMLNRELLTDEFLQTWSDASTEYIHLHADFRFVALYKMQDPPSFVDDSWYVIKIAT
jgi:hypothetical protein